jgi:four helix bundle protein
MKITEEESDECLYWLELLEKIQPDKKEKIACLKKEADEITAILVASVKTARANMKRGS